MLNAGPSGFVNAPLTKAILTSVVTLTLFASISGTHQSLTLPSPHGFLTHNLVFSTPGELLFGAALLYFFRHTERLLSTPHVTALLFTSALLHALLALILPPFLPSFPLPASGPYALLAPLLLHHALETPPLYTFSLLPGGTLAFSDKIFPALLAAQLGIANLPTSLPSLISASLVALILRAPFVARNLRCPAFVSRLAETWVLPWMDTAPRMRRRGSGARGAGRVRVQRTGQAVSESDNEGPAVDDDAVDTIVGMGFERDQVRRALQETGGDVAAATERLLR